MVGVLRAVGVVLKRCDDIYARAAGAGLSAAFSVPISA